MRRNGTAQITQDRWGDGKWHFHCEADKIVEEPSGIGLFVDGVQFPKDSWNALSKEERRAMCIQHTVQFKVVDQGDCDKVEGKD